MWGPCSFRLGLNALMLTLRRRTPLLDFDLRCMTVSSRRFLLGCVLLAMTSARASQPLYEGDAFTLTDTSVTQGDFRAAALSRTQITSNYQRETTRINFKFSLNRRDNERQSGDDRRLRFDPDRKSVV